MDPKLFELALELLLKAPQLIGMVYQTYELYKGGAMTQAQLEAIWASTKVGVAQAEAGWAAAAKPGDTGK